MRIVYLTSTLPMGKGEAFLISEVQELLRQGHEVLIVPMHPRGSLLHADASDLLVHACVSSLISWRIFFAFFLSFFRQGKKICQLLRLLLKSRTFPILCKNLIAFPKSVWLGDVVRSFSADHIHAHWAATTATMAMIAHELTGVPWSFTSHRWDLVEDNLFSIKMESAEFVRFISQSGIEMAQKLPGVQGAFNAKARLLHLGVAIPSNVSRNHLMRPSQVVLCPANLIPVKGHSYLVEAFAELQKREVDASLWIAGAGELLEALTKQVSLLDLQDQVRFLGQVPHGELLGLYGNGEVDVVVLPSLDLGGGLHEGIPVSLIEAMSYEIPVLSTTTGGIPELVTAGAGLLVPPQNVSELANALELLLKNSALRRMIGWRGRQQVLAQFAVQQVVTTLTDWFAKQEEKRVNHELADQTKAMVNRYL